MPCVQGLGWQRADRWGFRAGTACSACCLHVRSAHPLRTGDARAVVSPHGHPTGLAHQPCGHPLVLPAGTLPPSWGTKGAFQNLDYLAMCCQNLTGEPPAPASLLAWCCWLPAGLPASPACQVPVPARLLLLGALQACQPPCRHAALQVRCPTPGPAPTLFRSWRSFT